MTLRYKIIFILSVFIVLIPSLSCSPKVRSFFFDGVPEQDERAIVPGGKSQSDTLLINELAAKIVTPQYYYHPPYQNKKCGLCHDQGSKGRLLKPQGELCITCHDDFNTVYKFVHGPAASGYCTSCHNPHLSEREHLLVVSGKEMCLKCHDEKQVFATDYHKKSPGTDCTTCHNPHGGNRKYFLN